MSNSIVKLREYQDALHYVSKLCEYAEILEENPAVFEVMGDDYEAVVPPFALEVRLNNFVTKMEYEIVRASHIDKKPKRRKLPSIL